MSSDNKRILAFDIGIKNLAWCCGDISDVSGRQVTVRGWANENLISGATAEEDAISGKCGGVGCKMKAAYFTTDSGTCVRHCSPLTPAFRDLSGNLLKKIPSMTVLKDIAKGVGAGKEELKTKEKVLAFLRTKYSFPLVKSVVKKVELEDIHDGLRAVVLNNRELFASCSEILLENQPAFKNPVMKSVQMMLFATLRDLLSSGRATPPKVRLVHAGRKTAGVSTEVKKGDEGYSDRKNASEARITDGFTKGKILMGCSDGRGTIWFSKQAKRSDLADCLSMVIDCA
jgi:hypothetical protein